ncbi:MAG: C40 family peptidase [Deltaproteobacteria bacterium]|nr:C40 family peptidase [Deltaproteobacteria bacterium]
MQTTYQCFFRIYIAVILSLFLAGCGGSISVTPDDKPFRATRFLAPTHFTVQVGAFTNQNNAVRLTNALQRQGLNAYHFIHKSGFYKVRFGNFSTKNAARKKAENLKASGVIDAFYIVSPQHLRDENSIRRSIVKTAENFIGIPYRWGGASPKGFDCSGLSMTVYQLNGLNLPRTSREQWKVGKPVLRRQLSKGDLVFFATSGWKKVSHVGIYKGNNKFIHASGTGKKIRIDSLSGKYYRARYVGARKYF